MAKITFEIKGQNTNSRGIATKDGVEYEMKELQTRWKLVAERGNTKVEFAWSKKDIPTLSGWCEELSTNGYIIALND